MVYKQNERIFKYYITAKYQKQKSTRQARFAIKTARRTVVMIKAEILYYDTRW